MLVRLIDIAPQAQRIHGGCKGGKFQKNLRIHGGCKGGNEKVVSCIFCLIVFYYAIIFIMRPYLLLCDHIMRSFFIIMRSYLSFIIYMILLFLRNVEKQTRPANY